MKSTLLVLLSASLSTLLMMGVAQAGGGSDSSGEGYHCYLFFEDLTSEPSRFAQAMMNEEDVVELIKKRNEYLDKYLFGEGMVLTGQKGNISLLACSRAGENCEICTDGEIIPF